MDDGPARQPGPSLIALEVDPGDWTPFGVLFWATLPLLVVMFFFLDGADPHRLAIKRGLGRLWRWLQRSVGRDRSQQI